VAIFPEGEITRTCHLGTFHKGFELIDSYEWEGVLVPFYIDGMQGSLFARCSDGRPKPLFRREVRVCFFSAQSKSIKAKELQEFIEREKKKC
jgi:1-acyl-sn-glycerol-3-phosphate acyltransferase